MKDIKLYWFEEVLQPHDFDGHRILKERVPWVRWTTGEHEYTRYGFRKLRTNRGPWIFYNLM